MYDTILPVCITFPQMYEHSVSQNENVNYLIEEGGFKFYFSPVHGILIPDLNFPPIQYLLTNS